MPTQWPGAEPLSYPRSPNSKRPRTSCSTGSSSPVSRYPPRRSDPPVAVRVVIAEDEAIIRLDLKETLEEEGYEVVAETGRGDEAVALVRERNPDIAILDIKMPGMDGLAAARESTAERRAAGLILAAFS